MSTSRRLGGRPLVWSGMGVGGLSVMFPLVAGWTKTGDLPAWVGVLDVVVAFVWIVVMMAIEVLAQGRIEVEIKTLSYRIYRWLAHLLLVLLVMFFLMGDQINWGVLLPGLGWRLWLLVYTLPAALAVWRADP